MDQKKKQTILGVAAGVTLLAAGGLIYMNLAKPGPAPELPAEVETAAMQTTAELAQKQEEVLKEAGPDESDRVDENEEKLPGRRFRRKE